MKVLEKGPGWSIKQKCTGRGNGGCGCESTLLIEKFTPICCGKDGL